MAQSHVLSLRKDIALIERADGQMVLQGAQINFAFNPLPSGVLVALKVLCTEGATEPELGQLVLQNEGTAVLPYFYLCMHQLNRLKVLCRTILSDESPLATLMPLSFNYQYQASEVEPETTYVLSRFAYCRQDNHQVILESPLAAAQLVLHSWQALALWSEMKVPRNSYELAATIPSIGIATIQEYLGLLLNVQAITESESTSNPESINPALAQWEFHDLLFHSRSRMGRHTNPYGGTYRFVDKFDSLPAVKPVCGKEVIPLFQPDLQQLTITDPPFTAVLEGRRSLRQQGDPPLTADQLGEFLFRTARVKALFQDGQQELSSRPYPSGGAIYELEIYAIIAHCSGIPFGLYHYCPRTHFLNSISDCTPSVDKLLEATWYSTGKQCHPQVLFVITARFPRVSWKYHSMAYALVLKHVGVLYQTMYLVGTAMGLAPCALGGGDSDLFTQVAGLDYYAETSVGEFILGSRAANNSEVPVEDTHA